MTEDNLYKFFEPAFIAGNDEEKRFLQQELRNLEDIISKNNGARKVEVSIKEGIKISIEPCEGKLELSFYHPLTDLSGIIRYFDNESIGITHRLTKRDYDIRINPSK